MDLMLVPGLIAAHNLGFLRHLQELLLIQHSWLHNKAIRLCWVKNQILGCLEVHLVVTLFGEKISSHLLKSQLFPGTVFKCHSVLNIQILSYKYMSNFQMSASKQKPIHIC
jgi:hypothetical protein